MASAAEQWAERVRRQERSGLSLRRFAEREGLKAESLSFWKWKLGQERRGGKRTGAAVSPVRFQRFAEVVPAGTKVTVLADCGFGDQALYELLKDQLGFDFIVRFRGVIKVTSA